MSSSPPILAIVIALLSFISAVFAWSNLSRRKKTRMHLTIKWNSDKFSIPYPAQDTPLATIRQQVAEYTHLPRDGFKLIHSGAVMKDDSAPISAYRLRPSSKIVVVGSTEREKKQVPQVRTEQSVISQIQAELANVRETLAPSLDTYLASEKPPASEDKERLRISELLLQSLLRLDSINAEPDWQEARKERKGAVKEVQSLLDRLDGRTDA